MTFRDSGIYFGCMLRLNVGKADTQANNGGLRILADSAGFAILLFIALLIAT